MTEFGFPKHSRAKATGRSGEAWFGAFVAKELGWIYRSVHLEDDFGIDGFVDVVEGGAVTGRGFGVQIKCGDSYVAKRTEGGLRFDGENKHLNYYLNHAVPVILIVLDSACEEGYWTEFDVDRTIRSGSGWWIEVPDSHRLDSDVLAAWRAIAGDPTDYSEELEAMWSFDETLDRVPSRTVGIAREDVEQGNIEVIQSLLARLSKTRGHLLKNRGTLNIFFGGYDLDPCEIYEIPAARAWFELATEAGVPWFYFLDTSEPALSIRLLLLAMCDVERAPILDASGHPLVSVVGEDQARWLERHFLILNGFAEQHGISEDIIRERSFAVIAAIGGDEMVEYVNDRTHGT